MSSQPLNPTSFRFPFALSGKAHPEVERAIRWCFNGLTNHEQAFAALKSQGGVSTSSSATSSSSGSGGGTENVVIGGGGSAGVTSFNNLAGAVTYVPQLGFVNLQTGVTAYTVQQSDAGEEIVLNDASPIAVTINPAVLQVPWFTTISNQGAGAATITPQSGTINGGAALTLPGGSWVTVFFDGTNFWADSPGSTVGGVTQLLAGAGITLSPVGGTGVVTVTVIGATGSYTSGNNANGYWQKDPAGLIRQWGHVTAGVTGTVVTFPTAFSNATSIEVNTTSLWSSGSIAFVSVESGSITTAQFQVAMGVTATQEFNWYAIGY